MEKTNTRLTKSDWLDCALHVLALEGVNGVRVERLARKLGVTKGSFYWHFRDREDLLDRLIEYWMQTLTIAVREATKEASGGPEQRLFALMREIRERHAADFDVAVRAWGAHDPKVARIVERVDAIRLDYVRSLFREMGFRGRQAEIRARFCYFYEAADPMILAHQDAEEEKKQLKLRHKFLTMR